MHLSTWRNLMKISRFYRQYKFLASLDKIIVEIELQTHNKDGKFSIHTMLMWYRLEKGKSTTVNPGATEFFHYYSMTVAW